MVKSSNSYNMRRHLLVVVLYGLLLMCSRFKQHLALFENVPGSVSQNSETKLINSQPKQDHPRMSCYACSTMDYESPTDNICRNLRLQHRAPPGSFVHTQAGNSHLHYAHQTPIMTTTTTTTTSTTDRTSELIDDGNSRHLPGTEALISSSPAFDDSMSYQETTAATTTSLSNSMSNSGQSSKVQASYKSSAIGTNMTQSGAQPSDRRRILQNRTLVPGGFIKTRQCLDDENFCSIVSVVRIEFVQDNIFSKFWALERNCSKSCNTGCMVIGERVRLRVCSQCCRTPNCNVGSGAESKSLLSLSPHTKYILNFALSVSIGLMLIFRYESDMIMR